MGIPVDIHEEEEFSLRQSWSSELCESHESGWATKRARQDEGIGWGEARRGVCSRAKKRRRRGIRVRDGGTDPKAIPKKGEERRLDNLPIQQSCWGGGWVEKVQGEKEGRS